MVDRVVRGGDTLLGCEAARSSRQGPFLRGWSSVVGVWLVLPGTAAANAGRVLVWGCFLRTA